MFANIKMTEIVVIEILMEKFFRMESSKCSFLFFQTSSDINVITLLINLNKQPKKRKVNNQKKN
jgi:hypothetical protein